MSPGASLIARSSRLVVKLLLTGAGLFFYLNPRGKSEEPKELTTNAPIVPHSSSILIISSRAGPFLPGPFPPCRPGQTRTLCGGKKLRTVFLRHLLRHFLRHLLRHEHVGTMQLKPASEKQSTPSGPPTIRSY